MYIAKFNPHDRLLLQLDMLLRGKSGDDQKES
jgi:hypothetical protein